MTLRKRMFGPCRHHVNHVWPHKRCAQRAGYITIANTGSFTFLDTRTGLKLDSKDPRSKSFLYLMNMLPKMKNPPKYILVENVKGFDVGGFIFETKKKSFKLNMFFQLTRNRRQQESDSRDVLIQQLEECDYTYQEFLLNPLQMGIPNSRLRYYLLVSVAHIASDPSFKNEEQMLLTFETGEGKTISIRDGTYQHHHRLCSVIKVSCNRV